MRVGSRRRFRGTRRVGSGRVLKRVTRGQLCGAPAAVNACDASRTYFDDFFDAGTSCLHDVLHNFLVLRTVRCKLRSTVRVTGVWRSPAVRVCRCSFRTTIKTKCSSVVFEMCSNTVAFTMKRYSYSVQQPPLSLHR